MKKTTQHMNENNLQYYRKKSMFYKTDIFVVLLVVIAIIFSIIFITNKTEGQTVEIYYKGDLIESHSLSSNKEIIIKNNGHSNTIIINNGKVFIANANCRDKLCVKSSPITYANQRIICAPNGIVIIIKGKADIDGITGGAYAN